MAGDRIPLAEAKALAHKAVKTLQTVCQRVEIAEKRIEHAQSSIPVELPLEAEWN